MDLTLDQMITKLKKDMDKTGTGNNFHPDWLGWVSQNKVFKLKNINIDSVSPADGWQGNKDNIDNMFKSNLSDAPIIVVHKNGGIIDGNHRHQALKKQGAKTIQAYVGEGKMDLKLVNQEISEARLYRTSRNFNALTGEDISKLFYLTSISTFMMLNDDKQYDYAKEYVKQTVQYGPYTLFRSHATDLYLLGHVIKDPDTRSITLKNPITSKQYLKKLNFDNRKHYMFFMKLKTSSIKGSEFNSYFMRLESQLKITDSKYKQWRRLISDWSNLKFSSKQLVVSRLLQEYRRLGRGSEMVSPLSTMAKYRGYNPSKYQEPKTSLAKRAVGTVAGAAAGRYIGKKVAKKLGKDIDKYKKYGTGIGAVAGYWASGRKKQ